MHGPINVRIQIGGWLNGLRFSSMKCVDVCKTRIIYTSYWTKNLDLFSNLSMFYMCLTLRLLMSYIYMEHLFLMFLDHTRRTIFGRTPLDE